PLGIETSLPDVDLQKHIQTASLPFSAAMTSLFLSSPSSLYSSLQPLDRVQDWIHASSDSASLFRPPTPPKSPPTTPTRSLKRPRAASPCDMDNDITLRSSSPSERRRKHDDALCTKRIAN
ncbi:hypothetical protein IQ07DRAFT_525515, partial [Pyrenochaeta sp. DS3sAY3a]